MIFPFDLTEISMFLATISFLLLVTSEMIAPHYEKTNLLLDRKRLQAAAIFSSIMFLSTFAIRILSIIIS